LYLPAHFNETRTDVLHALMRARPLTTLVTQCESGLIANHLPVQTLDEPAPLGCIRGHIARANPLWREYRSESQALAIFQGPQIYISPSFYPSKAATGEVVPTWDYAVVHAGGTLRFIHDAQWLRSFVAGLTNTHEMPRSQPWKIDDAPAAYIEKMLSLIVGFEFSIVSLAGKWKVSQNRPQADRQGVIRNLRGAADADSHEIAAMLASLDPGPESPPTQ
jgi:transcriptional regulator